MGSSQGSGSINSIVAGDNDVLELTIVITGDEAIIVPSFKPTTGAKQFAAGPTGTGGAVTMRPIAPGDLPPATNTTLGAVSTPDGGGLRIEDPSGVGQNADVVIDNDIIASIVDNHIVTYSDKGLVLSGREIRGTDLPDATAGTSGVIKAGTEFTVDPATGILKHANQVSPGTFPKVTYDGQGHIKSGSLLDATDIPELSADKITSGELSPSVIGDGSITKEKLADYATCLMQEDNPGAGDFLGQFWYTPSTAQLRVYSRGSGPQNIWLPVGFGALQANNLRWGGTFDASTDKVGSVTAIGVSEGLVAGSAFPAPSDELSGLYLVCQVEGNNCTQNNIAGLSFDGGDWALCLDGTQGWVIIDANTGGGGGGGGGGANYLNDLLDVTIGGQGGPFSTAPQAALSDRQLLKYDSGDGMWKNTDLIDGGSF